LGRLARFSAVVWFGQPITLAAGIPRFSAADNFGARPTGIYGGHASILFMATSSNRKKKPGSPKRTRQPKPDETLQCIEAYKMWFARKPMEDICASLDGISERTAQRKIARGKAIVEAAKAIAPPGYTKIEEPPKEKPAEPGSISRGVHGISQGLVVRGPSNHGTIAMPKQNPLAGITDIADMGKIGIHTGVILGGAAHDIQEAFTRTDLPLDQRMLTLTRGSSVAANAVLGLVEMLRVLDVTTQPIKEVQDGQE